MERSGSHDWKRFLKRSDCCKVQMMPQPVNTTSSNQVGGEWRSQLICQQCGESELTVLSVTQIMNQCKAIERKRRRHGTTR
jgi:hypothetical protein